MSLHRWSGPLALLFATALAGCTDEPTSLTSPDSPDFGHNAVGDATFGTTPGWYKGETVTFFYHKDFFCKEPPASAAASHCEIGEEAQIAPRPGKNLPVLYVMTPLGFTPDDLQCPEVGSCINHPATIDASRVFGAGAEEIPLPAHSHIIDEIQGNWWEIEVVGVTDPAVWAEIEQAKSLDRVRELQAAGAGITPDIPSNLFLFFSVRK